MLQIESKFLKKNDSHDHYRSLDLIALQRDYSIFNFDSKLNSYSAET